MPELFLFSKGGALHPFNEEAESFIKKKNHKMVLAKVSEPRNLAHLRKFFAMIDVIYENQSHYSKDELVNLCKIRAGHVVYCKTKDGIERWPSSISFAKLEQSKFNDFYDRAVDWVCAEVIPGLDKGCLSDEVANKLRAFGE